MQKKMGCEDLPSELTGRPLWVRAWRSESLSALAAFVIRTKIGKDKKRSVPSQAPPTPGLVLGGAKETWYLPPHTHTGQVYSPQPFFCVHRFSHSSEQSLREGKNIPAQCTETLSGVVAAARLSLLCLEPEAELGWLSSKRWTSGRLTDRHGGVEDSL